MLTPSSHRSHRCRGVIFLTLFRGWHVRYVYICIVRFGSLGRLLRAKKCIILRTNVITVYSRFLGLQVLNKHL